MSEERLPSPRVGDADRERVVDLLRTAGADGRLDLEELAERVELAQRARTRADLEAVTADLVEAPGAAGSVPAAPEPVRESALFSHLQRRGRWRLDAHTRLLSVCGTIDLDLRHAELAAPEVLIEVTSWFGTTTVLVPEGVDVRLEGGGLFGSQLVSPPEEPPPPGAPVVRIRTGGGFGTLHVRSRPHLHEELAAGARELAERFLRPGG